MIEHRARSLFARLVFNIVERGESFVRDIPLAEDLVDDAGGEAGGDEAAHHTRGFLFVLRLADALALEMLAGQSLFVGLRVSCFDRLGNEIRAHAFLAQVLAHAARTEFLIFLAQAGVRFGKGPVVEIASFFELRNDGGDYRLAALSWLDALPHEAAQFGLGAHVPAERLDGVIVEAGLVERLARFCGFGSEGQVLSPAFDRKGHR